jgi:DNA-binding MarR family transcriptional regulator
MAAVLTYLINGATDMTDFIDMTKAELAALIGGMTASQIKKTSHADLVQMAGEKARPTEPNLINVLDDSDALHAVECPDAGELDDPEPPTADNLTDLEKRVLVAHLEAGIDCNGAETLDAMRADNMTWSDVKETSNRTGLTKKQVSGVIASLSTKGLLDTDVEKPNGQPGVDQVLTDKGVRVAFDLLGDGVVANQGPTPAPKADAAKADKPARKARVLEDRVIQKAATDLAKVRPMTDGSKRHLLAQALLRGATLEHLVEVTAWSRSTVTSALRWDMAQVGLGVERKGDKYFLIMPEGLKRLPVREATISRADALVAACK